MRAQFASRPATQGFKMSNPLVLDVAPVVAARRELHDAGGVTAARRKSVVCFGAVLRGALEAVGVLAARAKDGEESDAHALPLAREGQVVAHAEDGVS